MRPRSGSIYISVMLAPREPGGKLAAMPQPDHNSPPSAPAPALPRRLIAMLYDTLLVLPLENLMPGIPALGHDEDGAEAGEESASTPDESSGGWYIAVGVRGEVLYEAELAPLVNGLLTQVGLGGEEADRAHVCVTELINNAIDHGVLGLDSSLKQSPDGFERYFRERRKRLKKLKEGGVFVRAHLDRMGRNQCLRVAVSDSGSGFGTGPGGEAAVTVNGDLPAHVPHGRGIRLVQRLADRLVFHDGGATAEFHITVTAHTTG